MNKTEILEWIESEQNMWQQQYNDVAPYLYPMVSACFRAGCEYTILETKSNILNIFDDIDSELASFFTAPIEEERIESLNKVYSIIITFMGEDYINEIKSFGEEKQLEISTADLYEAADIIDSHLVSRENIKLESLVRLQTLQAVKNKITGKEDSYTI